MAYSVKDKLKQSYARLVKPAQNYLQQANLPTYKANLRDGFSNVPYNIKTNLRDLTDSERMPLFQARVADQASGYKNKALSSFAKTGVNLASSRYVAPILQAPQAVKNIATPGKRLQGFTGLLGAVGAATPDPFYDVAFPAYDALKGAAAAKNQGISVTQGALSGFSGEKYNQLGSSTKNPYLEKILNMAELPAMFIVPGMLQKSLANANPSAMKQNFRMDKFSFDELVDAEEMVRNPQNFIGKIQVNSRTEKEAIKEIGKIGRRTIDRLASRYLPNKEYDRLKTPEALAKALAKLHQDNKLANVRFPGEPGNSRFSIPNLFGNKDMQMGLMGGQQATGYGSANKFSSLLDKKPRFEIDDSRAKLKEGWFGKGIGGTTLDEIIDHEKLFKQYPQLKKVSVNIENFQGNAFYDPKKNNITISEANVDLADPKSSLLHEIQHAIQEVEGFARGGDVPESIDPKILFARRKDAVDIRTRLSQLNDLYGTPEFNSLPQSERARIGKEIVSLEDQLNKIMNEEKFGQYQRLSGELEARAVQRRMDMPANQRGKTDPYAAEAMATTGTTKPGDYITRFDGGVSQSVDVSKPNITQLRKQVQDQLSQNQTSAELAKHAREALGDDLITKVNQLKKVAKNKTFASGDIETLRSSKYRKLTNEVVESIQEARPDLDEAGALDFALGLPTKNDTRVRKPAELKTLRELETREKIENKLWEQEFGRNLKEDEFRRMERDWLKSYTSENKVTPKIKGRQERAAVRDNEQALRRLEGEWAASYRTDAPATAKIKNIQDRSAIRQNERQMGRMTNEWQQEANPGVIKPYNRGDLNTQQPFGIMKNFETAKDKGAFSYARETAVRNIEETFGKDAPKVKAFVTDKITENETNAVKFRDSIASQLKSVVKKNRIGKSSKDDALVFRFAEGRIDKTGLARETKNVKGVIATATEFRATYDRLLDGINASLSKYGYDPIPKRKDYMTHFQEVGNFFENFGAIFQDKTMRDNLGDKLPTGMSGINMDTKPGKEFFRNALPRTGDKFTESAIGAMERYLEPASRQIYHTDSVQRVRALQSMVEQHAGKSGKNLSNFNSWLSEYGNILAGKKSVVDRPIEKILGRGLLKVGNAVRRRTGANMVGGNLSSALTNFIPLSQSIATTSKPAVMKGLLSSISTDARKIDGVESGFLTRRFQDASIAKNWTEKASDMASWAFKAVDHFSSRMIVGSKYYEGLSRGMDATSAMRQADDYAARIMADRSFGASPVLFNSQVLGALTQFQLEVNNQLSFIMKDIPKNLGYSKAQVASSIGQVLLYSYLFNGAYEKVTGRRPAFDPLGVALQAKEDYSNEDMKKGQATKNLAQNLVNQIPFASVATGGRMPMSAALPDVGKLASGESTLGKEALKPLTYLAPPFGGGQIKKTIEGLRSYNQGASTTPSGRVRYPIEKTPVNAVRTAAFGQYSTPEARNYFRSGTAPMGEKQSGRILSGITSGLFGGNKVSAAENSTALNIPTNPEEAKIFYKQALQEINNAKSNRIKYTYDSSLTEDERKKKLDTEMEKNIRAVNTINQMRKQNPEQVFGYELESHATGGSKTTEQRAKWVHQTLKTAKSDKELSDLLRKLYQGKVLTQSVAEMLNEEYGLNLTHYMSGDKLKSLGGSGKKGKKTISDAQILSSYRKTLEAYAKPRARYKSFSEEMGNRQSAPIRLKRQKLAKLY